MIFDIDNYVYDPVIEKKPILTKHAEQRKKECRSGSFVYVKSGNTYIIITILPKKKNKKKINRKIPLLHYRRKNKLKKYKFKG